MAVGDTLHRIARNVCSSDVCGRVLEPALADLQHEYALTDGTAAQLWSLVRRVRIAGRGQI